jgi:hypothetical protein
VEEEYDTDIFNEAGPTAIEVDEEPVYENYGASSIAEREAIPSSDDGSRPPPLFSRQYNKRLPSQRVVKPSPRGAKRSRNSAYHADFSNPTRDVGAGNGGEGFPFSPILT